MKEQTGETYQSGEFAKAMMVSEAKVGKSTFIIAAALGCLPWQKKGGIVDDPKNLHVIAVDAGAVAGVRRFLTETCNAPPEALKFNIYNMQDDLRKIAASDNDWDYGFYNTLMQTIERAQQKAKGVPVLHASSLTGLAAGLLRGISGPPQGKSSMDQAKWGMYSSQLNELRNFAQVDLWHCIWEGHIYKPPATGQSGEARPETIQLQGSAGHNFPYNVEQVFRVRRNFGKRYTAQGSSTPTKCDEVYLDTQPTLDFIANGRGFNEALQQKEWDPTDAFARLGLKVGGWGAKGVAPKKVAAPAK